GPTPAQRTTTRNPEVRRAQRRHSPGCGARAAKRAAAMRADLLGSKGESAAGACRPVGWLSARFRAARRRPAGQDQRLGRSPTRRPRSPRAPSPAPTSLEPLEHVDEQVSLCLPAEAEARDAEALHLSALNLEHTRHFVDRKNLGTRERSSEASLFT